MDKRTITKITEERHGAAKIGKLGLNRMEAFLLEKECLTLLNNNFKCICSKPRTHFPKITECDPNKFEFELTHCGVTVDNFGDGFAHKVFKRSAAEQMECIIQNLKTNKIVHYDIALRNLCINEDGDLSLIDFDVATIGECWEHEEMEHIMVEQLQGISNVLAK